MFNFLMSGLILSAFLSPSLNKLMIDRERGIRIKSSVMPLREGDTDFWVDVFAVGSENPELCGATVLSRAGNVCVVRVPVSYLKTLSEHFDVFPSVKIKPYLDKVAEKVNVAMPWTSGVGGRGVIVGVVDTGVDFTHPDIAGRIIYLWDQLNSAQYTREQINDSCPEKDYNGHGTHVVGIAAGNGSASDGLYKGMAPESDIIFVKTTFYSSDIMNGIFWIITKAESEGKPVVVNLSLGGHQGPHDGTSAESIYMDSLVGPGRIIVAAAGNEGDEAIHNCTNMSPGQTVDFVITVTNSLSSAKEVYVDVWQDGEMSAVWKVIDPSGNETEFVSNNQTLSTDLGSTAVYLSVGGIYSNNGDREIDIKLGSSSSSLPTGDWTLRVSNVSGSGSVHLWIYYSTCDYSGFLNPVYSYTISDMATGNKVIAVASMTTKKEFYSSSGTCYIPDATVDDISTFSSRGPTRDGRHKPDISAPGEIVSSLRSKDASYDSVYINGKYNSYVYMQGTSMATPVVSGGVALILQNNPSASFSNIIGSLISNVQGTAYKSDPGTWDERWGYGVLDLASVSGGTPQEPVRVSFRNTFLDIRADSSDSIFKVVVSRNTTQRIRVTVEVYDTDGRKVETLMNQGEVLGYGDITISWDVGGDSRVKTGLYFVKTTVEGEDGQVLSQNTTKILVVR